MNFCKMTGCNKQMHALGFCKRHYYVYRKENGLLPDQRKKVEVKVKAVESPPEQRKERTDSQNYSFFLNQKFIEKIFMELVKIYDKALYRANNLKNLEHYLNLCIYLSGYEGKQQSAFYADFMDELKTWAEARDKIRFMEALANWEQRAAAFDRPEKVTQLSLFKS